MGNFRVDASSVRGGLSPESIRAVVTGIVGCMNVAGATSAALDRLAGRSADFAIVEGAVFIAEACHPVGVGFLDDRTGKIFTPQPEGDVDEADEDGHLLHYRCALRFV